MSSSYRCPLCKSEGPFTVACSVSMDVDTEQERIRWPDTLDLNALYWDNGSEMTCGRCSHYDKVRAFMK